MIKRIVPAALMGATVLGFTACNKGGSFKTTKDGLEYKIVNDVAGDRKPQLGDIIEMHVKTRIGDSSLFDSYKMNNNQPVQFPLMAGAFKGDLPEGLMMLTPGDSAVFRVSLDSVRKKRCATATMGKTYRQNGIPGKTDLREIAGRNAQGNGV